MKSLILTLAVFACLPLHANIKKQTHQTYADMTGGDETVYTVTTGKDLDLKTILFSASNASAAATFQLKDSASVFHTFYLPEKESGGHNKTINQAIDFDEPWTVEDNIILSLVAGDSGAVSASVSIIGVER